MANVLPRGLGVEETSTAIKMQGEEKRPLPWWALHRRLYDWVLSLAHTRYGPAALFAIAFAESSFFPIPPDVLQIALTLERRERAWRFALISLIGSVFGALCGYMIGMFLWRLTEHFFYSYFISEQVFTNVKDAYDRGNFLIVFTAAFTPIPYKIITIAAGVCEIGLPLFIIASVVGRGGRFFLVASLLYIFGPAVKKFIDRYFNLVCVAFTVLLVGGFLLIKYLAH